MKPHRTPRIARLPVMGKLRDEFGITMHVALRSLETTPTVEAFDALAEVFNLLQVDLQNDRRRARAAAVINDGAGALIDSQDAVAAGQVPLERHLKRMRAAVNTIDDLIGKLDINRLYLSMQKLKALKKQAALEAA